MRAALAALLALALADSCGGGSASLAGPPCATTGSADPASFTRSFSAMTLAGGGPGDAESEASYSKDQTVTVVATATAAATARFCVNYRDGSNRIAADVSKDLAIGETRVDLGTFGPASYVVRVTVGGSLVKNLTFVVR